MMLMMWMIWQSLNHQQPAAFEVTLQMSNQMGFICFWVCQIWGNSVVIVEELFRLPTIIYNLTVHRKRYPSDEKQKYKRDWSTWKILKRIRLKFYIMISFKSAYQKCMRVISFGPRHFNRPLGLQWSGSWMALQKIKTGKANRFNTSSLVKYFKIVAVNRFITNG